MNKRAVALILPYNNKFEIILQRRKGFIDKPTNKNYGFFGGHLEEGENIEQALKREIEEELSINIKDIKSLKFFRVYKYEVKEKNIMVELHVFLCKMEDVAKMKVNEGKPTTFKLKEVSDLNISSMDKQILEEVYDYLNSVKKVPLN